MNENPLDPTHKFDFDLPAEGEDTEGVRETLLGEGAESALKQKAQGLALTEGRAYAMLAEFVREQRRLRIEELLCTPITVESLSETNFKIGELMGLRVALKYAEAIAEGAEATIELLREEEKLNAGRTDTN